jgi:hypothetical protein
MAVPSRRHKVTLTKRDSDASYDKQNERIIHGALLRQGYEGQPSLNLPLAVPAEALAKAGGPKGIRTPRLFHAMEALYQMSYGPLHFFMGSTGLEPVTLRM